MRLYPDRKLFLSIGFLFFIAVLRSPLTLRSDDSVTETPSSDVIVTATSSATPTQTLTLMPSATLIEIIPTASETPSLTPTETPTVTETFSITDTPLSPETAGFTETLAAPTETPTSEAAPAGAVTETLTASETPATAQAEITEAPEVTATVTAEATFEAEITETAEATDTVLPTETATGTAIPMVEFSGSAHYQSRLPDDAGIEITISDGSGRLLTTATTLPDGSYTVLAPSEEFFWLVVSAPLYRPFKLGIWPGETVPEVILAGGDMDGDGCVGPSDLAFLTADFNADASLKSDISGDGHTDAADLAILAGNYDPDSCPPVLEVTATATPTVTGTDTGLITPTDTLPVEVTEAPVVTAEGTVEIEGGSH